MATPKVQKLEELMAGLEPAYAPRRGIVKKRMGAVPGRYDTQRQGLKTEKANEFRDINTSANSRGMAFSGMPIAEQTRYLGEQYLPTLGRYDQQENEELLALEEMLANLGSEQRLKAMDLRQGQVASRDSFLEAERQRRHQAEQNRLEREFQASQNAANRSATTSADEVSPVEAATSVLIANRGADGYVSPTTFRLARDLWLEAGGSNKEFMDRYWYMTGAGQDGPNQNNWQAYYYGSR